MNKVLVFVVLAILFSCASDRPDGKTEAEVLFKEAQKLSQDGKYLMATEKLNNLKAQHPYSFYAKHAELLLADILFEQDNFAEASAAYILYRDMHPKDEKIEYVIWKIAESFYKQIPSTFDRDLSMAVEAIKYYQEIVDKFPNSDHVTGSKEKVSSCKNMLRSKERYIADFYFKTEVYDSARYHYLDILKNFNEEELKNHAMLRVVMASYELKDYKVCLNYASEFSSQVSEEIENKIKNYSEKCQQGQ